LFWVKHGIVYTPPLAAGILPGVTRAVVFKIASRLKIPVREKYIRPKELGQADGIFLSLSSFGIVEAKSLDRKILRQSSLTRQIASAYRDLLVDSSACNSRRKP
jgi:branched-subunit amino acid aminotransferase/4-amino-4-deoxychorismate lyase